jgi:hypothetical protein
MNIQFAVKDEDGKPTLYVLEVNPRASRTVPFVAKATGVPVAKLATKVMTGHDAGRTWVTTNRSRARFDQGSVFPFRKFAGVDIVLGPEMRSTGEVMGISDKFFDWRLPKAKSPPGTFCPIQATSSSACRAAQRCRRRCWQTADELGFELLATAGTANASKKRNPGHAVKKIAEGQSEPDRLPEERRSAVDPQHAQRQRGADRRRENSRGRRPERRSLHHHHGRPWRFYIVEAAACRSLKQDLPQENAGKIPAMLAAADALILATWLPNPQPGHQRSVEEPSFAPTLANMEHIAAASAAVQNLLLAATARGISNYWSSGGVLRSEHVFSRLGIPFNQILLGAIFLFPDATEGAEVVGSKLREHRTASTRWSRRVS